MSLHIHIQDDHGERIFQAGDFPLEIGGIDADIRLHGCSASSIGQLGLESAAAYLHPDGSDIRVNGAAQTAPTWLRDGDVVSFADGRLVYNQRGERISIHARSHTAQDLPPAENTDDESGRQVIQPIAFKLNRGIADRSYRGTRILQAGVVGIFALLAVAIWFMFTARSVDLIIEPEPPKIVFDGAGFAPRIGGRYLLRPGAYRVMAELEGYQPLAATIEVGQSSNQQFSLQMEKLPGLLSVQTANLSGAEILIDGVVIGTTPLTEFEVSAGLHRLLIRARNHLPDEQEISVEGLHVRQSFAVTLQPNWAPVTINSNPSGATVLLDGEAIGSTPLTAELEAGDRELSLALPGFKTSSLLLSINAGEAQTVATQTLVAADGIVLVQTSPSNVSVSMNRQFIGRTPLEIPVRPDQQHRLSFSKPGYESTSRSVKLKAEQREQLSLSLQPVLGSLRIITSPADADVLIDGQSRGSAVGSISLNTRPHTIEVRKTGYASHVETITPRQGMEQRITVVLKTVAEAALGELPETVASVAGTFRLIRGGTLRMGSDRREQGRRSNEVRRDVELTREFYVSETEISNRVFREFAATHSSGFFGGVTLDGDDQPVVRVSWQQAARFCNWLGQRDGLPAAYVDRDGRLVAQRPMNTGYRLPTEAEWAWVARFAAGESARIYAWGDSLPPPDGAGNFADHAVGSLVAQRLDNYDDAYTVSAPVGSFPANALGLHELAGNVAEWTHDYYEVAAADPFLARVDPLGPQFGDQHVIRGASWMTGTIGQLRGAYRDKGAQGRPDLGFRVARYAR